MTTTLDGVEIRGPITAVQNFLIVKLKDTLLATGGGILLPDQSKVVVAIYDIVDALDCTTLNKLMTLHSSHPKQRQV